MKSSILKNNLTKNNGFRTLWIAIHSILFVMMAILFLSGKKFSINTNLFDILPQSNNSREVSKADAVLSTKTGRMFIVLVKGKDLSYAKSAAKKFVERLNEKDAVTSKAGGVESFEEISLTVDPAVMNEIHDYYFKNRYFLLDDDQTELLSSEEGILEFIDDANLNIYGGWSSVDNIDRDPFLLGESELMTALNKLMTNGTAMNLSDDVLSAYYDDSCYVMIRGILTPEGASITNKNSGIKKIYETAEQIKSESLNRERSSDKKSEESEIDFIFSGVPFHSYESSTSAQFEISLISTISLIIIILICIYVFRNGIPVVCSVSAIMVSALTAFCCVLVIFGEIHILTFVFGTTLIGTCLDYSVHFFVRWKADTELDDGDQIRKKLFKGLTLSLVSTEICYLLLMFSSFALLKQVAVFSFSGILSSYLTSICLYPEIKSCTKKGIGNSNGKKSFANSIGEKIKSLNLNHPLIKPVFLIAIVSASLIFIIIFRQNIRIDNNLKTFYSMKGKLLENEKESNQVLNPGTNGCYFIVKGKTKDEVLNNEARFVKVLEEYKTKKENKFFNYNCVTKYIPSKDLQKKSYNSFTKLLPFIKDQYLMYGMDSEESDFLTEKVIRDYQESENKFIGIEDTPDFIKSAVSSLWIGQVDDFYYSVIMPMHFDSSEEMKNLCTDFEQIYFVNKIADVSVQLNSLTKIMLGFLLIAFLLMIIVIKFFYSWKELLKIIVIPVITVLTCVSVLAAVNVPLGFFSVTGIILVFGLSIDYIIYAVEDSEKLNSVAIGLSFISSALSFGALALSSFAPVFMFGLSVFVGLTTAVICTMLIKK